jgi:predicted AlkP superfamily phosphohydrolase/phosphomutase
VIDRRKVIILGVDGLDGDLLDALESPLPNLRSLVKVRYSPVFPPDSVPAWASIQTGLPIETHRLLTSDDYLRLSGPSSGSPVSPLQGRTFYDRASQAGRRVIVVNPFLAYPPWRLNGLMVSGPVFKDGPVETWPREASSPWSNLPIGGLTDEPTRWNRSPFLQRALAEIVDLANPFIDELNQREWDCAFLTLLSLDRIKHFFWRFCDTLDPDYPGATAYGRAIEDAYSAIDNVVGLVRQGFPEAALLVLSDHGHCRRPKKLFELGEWLRRRGLIDAAPPNSLAAALERTKRTVVSGLSGLGLEDVTRLLAKAVPKAAELKDSSFAVSKDRSLVGICPFGRNTFGGLRVNNDDATARHDLMELLTANLSKVRSPSGEAVVRSTRVVERDADGRSIGLPDLEIELHPDYGVGRDLYGSLFSVSPYRRRISGGHGVSAAMLYGGPLRPTEEILPRTIGSMDLAPTVLALLGVDYQGDLLGRPFVEWRLPLASE